VVNSDQSDTGSYPKNRRTDSTRRIPPPYRHRSWVHTKRREFLVGWLRVAEFPWAASTGGASFVHSSEPSVLSEHRVCVSEQDFGRAGSRLAV